MAYQYLTYFEDDDAKLVEIADAYRAGTLTTGDLKKECITLLQEYVDGYQKRRKEVTDEVLELYMKPRKLEWARSNMVHVASTAGSSAGRKGDSKSKKPKDQLPK